MDKLNVWGVNWIDGMLVTSRHLNQQQDFAVNISRWNSLALAAGYGVVRSATDRDEPLDVQLRRDGDLLFVTVARLSALMPNGMLVNINADFTQHKAVELKIDISSESRERLPVYIYLSPDEKLPFGEPEAGEELSRAPYQVPALTMTIGSAEGMPSNCGFQIAELIRAGDDYKLADDFAPPFLSTSCGSAVTNRMEKLKQLIREIESAGLTSIAEIKQKTPTPAQEGIFRGIFLQSEALLHQIGYNYDFLFDSFCGVSARRLVDFFRGLVRGFGQGFLIYPELREYARTADLETKTGIISGGSVLPELQDYQSREYGFDQMTRFFEDTERILSLIQAILIFYASGRAGRGRNVIEIGGYRFQLQHHGAVKYSFRNNRHHIIIDGVEPRGTEDVVIRVHKNVLPQQYASVVIIYLGANEVDDIAAASVARKPVEDLTNPDFWLIQPNEYFPLKCERLDRLNIIIDGEVDRAAMEAVRMEQVAVFSRTR